MTNSGHHDEQINNKPGKINRKATVRTVVLIVCALIIAAGVYSAIAYFTDKVHVNTTFTFGNVEIIPDEPDYPPDDPPDTPNEETPKNPIIANNGSEICIVFMEVKVPVATFTLVNDDGTKGDETTTEIFWLKTNKQGADNHSNSFNLENWVLLNHTPGTTDGEYTTYLFGYKIPLNGTDNRIGNVLDPSRDELESLSHTDPLFDKVQIKNYLEGTLNGTYSIIVNSYGIQANYLDKDGNYLFGEDGVLNVDTLTEETLRNIWDIYTAQTA